MIDPSPAPSALPEPMPPPATTESASSCLSHSPSTTGLDGPPKVTPSASAHPSRLDPPEPDLPPDASLPPDVSHPPRPVAAPEPGTVPAAEGVFLCEQHRSMLCTGSAISGEVIAVRGYRTILDEAELIPLGFIASQRRTPGLLLPLWATDGTLAGAVYRPDNPRVVENKKKGPLPDGTYPCKVIKYEFPAHALLRVDCPPPCREKLGDPSVPLWVTEGQKKADALASRGLCAIALLGVWNFKGSNAFGGSTVLADFDYIAWSSARSSQRKANPQHPHEPEPAQGIAGDSDIDDETGPALRIADQRGRDVRIVFDSDVMTKPAVRQALDRLTHVLQSRGARVSAVYLPHGAQGKQGVDDFLAAGHTIEELNALVDAPRPLPRLSPPQVELLREEPLTLCRPLQLVGNKAYAAAWAMLKFVHPDKQLRSGEVVRCDPPEVTYERRLLAVREEGRIIGEGQDLSVEESGIHFKISAEPPTNRLWSVDGITAYHTGKRPVAADVFKRVVDVIDHFIDFDRSLAPQHTMAELVGCYILATWFLDAFHVIGYLWPNGPSGSGKTQLLTVVCELAYLGQVILAGVSFASLRDLADSGACLAFDDAEGFANSRGTDEEKRNLLLAGNRKGNVIPVKEAAPAPERGWRTRYVNTYCPRLFSATQLPDPILGSRTIFIPLVRSVDTRRANANPLDHSTWPHNHDALQDDLWALALANLSKLPPYESRAAEQSTLAGRSLEPWRAILAVAMWLEEHGVSGVHARMGVLSHLYQSERMEMETTDVSALLVRALVQLALEDHSLTAYPSPGEAWGKWILDPKVILHFSSADIAERALKIVRENEYDLNGNHLDATHTGMLMHKLRFQTTRYAQRRLWNIPIQDLLKLALSYNIPLPLSMVEPGAAAYPDQSQPDSNDEQTAFASNPEDTGEEA